MAASKVSYSSTVPCSSHCQSTGPYGKDAFTKGYNSGTVFSMTFPVDEDKDSAFDGSVYVGCHGKNSDPSSASAAHEPNAPSTLHPDTALAPYGISEVNEDDAGIDIDDHTNDTALQSVPPVAPVPKRKQSSATELKNCAGTASGKKHKSVPVANHPPAQSQAHYPYGHYPHPHYPYGHYYPYYPPHPPVQHGYAWPYPPHHAYPHYYPGYYPHPTPGKPVLSQAGKETTLHHKISTKHKKEADFKKKKAPMLSMRSTPVKPLPISSSTTFPPRDITVPHGKPDISCSTEMKDDQLPSSGPERRARKNAQSRMRAAKLKDSIQRMNVKNPEERTSEEKAKLATYEERRMRKNGRSRDRAMERKRRFTEINAKAEKVWNAEEKVFMAETRVSKYKKNEGDRMRRKKMRHCGYSIASSTQSNFESYAANDHHQYISSATLYPRQLPQDRNVPEQIHSSSRAPMVASAPPMTPKSPHQFHNEEGFAPNMFDVMTPKNDAAEENDFMSNFIFPSPSQDNNAYFNSPTLELCAETSIMDHNLDEIIYSPATTPRNANQQIFDTNGHNQVTLPLALCPLNLPRRSKTDEQLYDTLASDWRDIGEDDRGIQEAIAVSFSMEETV